MLGRVRAERRWQWAVCGKHPAAKDYFTLGDAFPLSKAFSEWMARGYDCLDHKRTARTCSWRFWTKEARKDHVSCGVIKESSDGVGRTYPLLLMGTGPLPGWRRHWDLVPFVCEASWAQIEYASTRHFADVRAFSIEVGGIKQPTTEWDRFAAETARLHQFPVEALRERLVHLPEGEPYLCLDREHYDLPDLIGLCHLLARSNEKEIPSAVFMGGTAERTYFAIFRRALSKADFVRMWDIDQRTR